SETFVRRSQVIDYLLRMTAPETRAAEFVDPDPYALVEGNVTDVLKTIKPASVQCVVTSTPYWGLRMYEDSTLVEWADSETCAYGHEQTPDGFVRHTVQILWQLRPLLTAD